MAQLAFGGTNTSTTGFTDIWVESPVTSPSGRAAANGQTLALITSVSAYASGNGAARNVALTLNGNGTAYFSVAAAASAQSTGLRACNVLTGGESVQFRITSNNGSFYFGRGGTGSTVDNNGTNRTDGDLGGVFNYAQSPTAPRTPAVSQTAPGEVTLTWTNPADNGEADLTGFRIEYGTSADFTGATVINHGTTLSRVISGLTPGLTYYFRIAAKNAVTDAGSTWSVFSASVSQFISSGGKAWNGTAWVPGNASVWNGTAWAPATVKVWNGTAWAPAL